MSSKILTWLLIVSVAINVLFLIGPVVVVADQFGITTGIMIGYSDSLIAQYVKEGALPIMLPKGIGVKSNISADEFLYTRVDEHHATLRSRVDHPLPFITTYIGCDINVENCDLSAYRNEEDGKDPECR